NRRLWPYGLAAAAVVILAVAAAMVLTRTQRRVAPPDEAEQHPPASPAAPSAASGPPRFVALTLAAPRRDLATTPTLTMSAGTDEARLTLRLEPSEFDRFNVDVRDASTNHIVWQTRHVVATRDTDGRSILITVPVAALRAGRCLVQLSSDAPRGEIIGEYSLRIVLESRASARRLSGKHAMTRGAVLTLGISLLLVLPARVATRQSTTPVTDAVRLERGQTIERTLAGAERHAYDVTLNAGDFVAVTADQHDADLVIRLLDPAGNAVALFDDEMRKDGRERAAFVADASRAYRLTIGVRYPLPNVTRGYSVRIDEQRPATDRDRAVYQ